MIMMTMCCYFVYLPMAASDCMYLTTQVLMKLNTHVQCTLFVGPDSPQRQTQIRPAQALELMCNCGDCVLARFSPLHC